MTGNFKILLLVLALSGAILAGQNTPAASITLSDGGYIQGDISSEAGQLLPYAKVYIYSSAYEKIDSVTCSVEGRYLIYLTSGKYYISAAKEDYCQKFYPSAYMISSARAVNIFPEQGQEIDISLQKGGSIRGGISVGSSQSGNFLMTAVKVDYPHNGWQQEKYFDVRGYGNYELKGLLPGYYKILLRGEGFHTLFYPQSITFDNAEIVEVVADEISEGIDFSPEQPGTGFLSGSVFDSYNSEPVEGARIFAYQWSLHGDDPNKLIATADDNGNFELELTGGYYYVLASIPNPSDPDNDILLYYDNHYDQDFAQAVYIDAGHSLSNINFVVDFSHEYNLEISGNLSDLSGERPTDNAELTAIDYFTGLPVASTRSRADGDFTIENLVGGSYLIGISGYGLVPTFWPDKLGWQQAQIIRLSNAHQNLNNGGAITQDYGTPGFSISGRINGPQGPIGGARVYAINYETGSVAYCYSNPSGSYEITTGLYAGSYSVFADLYGYDGTYYSMMIELDLVHNPHVSGIDITLSSAMVSADVEQPLPQSIELLGNYPNPFNSTTTIEFAADKYLESQIEIYNIIGQLVASLPISAKPGVNRINWNGQASSGVTVGTGVYFYRLGDLPQTRKMILLK